MANVQIIKLTSGEDIMGQVADTEIDGKAFLLVENPAVILMMPKPGSEDEFGVGLAPYAPFAKQHKVPVFPNHIISASKCTKVYPLFRFSLCIRTTKSLVYKIHKI